jgi:Arylsulfotransferase (ASST)
MPYRRRLTSDVSVYSSAKTCDGYTLFAPTFGKDAWLIDMNGRVCHHWELENPPASHGKLLPNGNLMWQAAAPGSLSYFVGSGSELVEYDWEGNKVWRWEEQGINHDFLTLPNGNIVINVYTQMPDEQAAKVKGGIPGTEVEGGRIYTSTLKEISREGEVLWEWSLADHLDPETDIMCPLCPRRVWGFINSLDLMPDGRILFMMRLLNDVGIMDPSSGEITWRFGRDKQLGHPHCCKVLENGNITLFDNGLHRHSATDHVGDISASRVIEIDPGSNEIVWQYMDPLAPNFYSAICSGAQRLPNGNTLICEATKGKLFEVTPGKEIVWEYQSPFLVTRPNYWGWTISATVWQAHRYAPDYPGLAGKDLDPGNYEFKFRSRTAKDIEEEETVKRLTSLGY